MWNRYPPREASGLNWTTTTARSDENKDVYDIAVADVILTRELAACLLRLVQPLPNTTDYLEPADPPPICIQRSSLHVFHSPSSRTWAKFPFLPFLTTPF